VWLIVAGAAIFAAFPGWYATWFSALYLALVLLLAALMARGTSFEFRGKRDSAGWRRMWDGLLTGGSLLVPLLVGIALGDLLAGLPIDKSQNYTGTFWDLFQPYGIYTGITLVAICVLHGATFVTLKTTGEVADRAARVAARSGFAVALIVIGWAVWTHVTAGKGFWPNPVEIGIVLVVIAAAWLASERHEGSAFACSTITIALAMLTLFTDLYPNVMISSTSSAYNLTIANTASPSYTLKRATEVYETYYDIKYPGHERQEGRPLKTAAAYPWHVDNGAFFGEKSGWERVNYYLPNESSGDESWRPRGWAGPGSRSHARTSRSGTAWPP